MALRLVLSRARTPLRTQLRLAVARGLCTPAQTFLDESEVRERVIQVVSNFEKVDPAKVTDTAHFTTDLGLDSLDNVELAMALEEEFALEMPDAEAEKILSITDAVNFISTHPQAK
eukprot:CAMPEP_0182463728 /NCGR_PEP_ID=MMETSP1319-20130603/7885_1 /TAXON_ID=172717 /ORGANISM="Bolidomonas pacifica, Strain RCC208" /LENGTH=115 /DNA_ID=CAMNT_0024663305 /DNA_START=20 /DNA_END=364 /DNA_ORIENTATION=-